LSTSQPSTQALSPPTHKDLWRRIYSRVGSNWKGLALAAVFMAIGPYTQYLLVTGMQSLLDQGAAARADIWKVPLAIVGLISLRGLCNFFSDYLLSWSANNVLLGMRRDMFEKLLTTPDHEFKKGDSGRLLNRFTVDAGNVAGFATDVLTTIVRESCLVVYMISLMLQTSWQLTLIIILTMPVSVLISKQFTRRLRKINRETISMNAELTRTVNEAIDGQRVIKLFDGYRYERERFSYVSGRLRRFDMRAATADAALTPITQVITAIAVATVIAFALWQFQHGGLTIGSFTAFLFALGQIFDPIKRLTKVSSATQKMLVSAESIFTLIDQASEFEAGQGDFNGPVKGRIEFTNLSHRFPDAESNTLNEVNITVEPGQTVALVGRSGSGKTTLVNMLPRFVLPLSGQVTIDGQDIAHLSLNNLRRQLSLVSQDVVLFDDTIAVNVGYGSLHEASEAEIRAALKAANLLDFVDSLPLGIRTQVGENATRLSGGQRQRLAIARALIKNAPILILDEATSALDNESERQVQASLETLMQGRTTVVIAHRLSTVQNADKIVVMDGGRVLEQGTHKELLAQGGAYCNLHQMGLN